MIFLEIFRIESKFNFYRIIQFMDFSIVVKLYTKNILQMRHLFLFTHSAYKYKYINICEHKGICH